MDNPFDGGGDKSRLIKELEEGPERISKAKFDWQEAILIRQKEEAKLFLAFKNPLSGEKRTAAEAEAMVHSNNERFDIRLRESVLEAEYDRCYERLMCAKKLADLRTAF